MTLNSTIILFKLEKICSVVSQTLFFDKSKVFMYHFYVIVLLLKVFVLIKNATFAKRNFRRLVQSSFFFNQIKVNSISL